MLKHSLNLFRTSPNRLGLFAVLLACLLIGVTTLSACGRYQQNAAEPTPFMVAVTRYPTEGPHPSPTDVNVLIAPTIDTTLPVIPHHAFLDKFGPLYTPDGQGHSVTSIAVVKQDIWVAFGNFSTPGSGGGVWHYDGANWKQYTAVKELPVSDNVQVLRAGPDGSVWAGAGCQLARHFDGVWDLMAGCDMMAGNITDIAFSSEGAVWVASAFKLTHFDGQNWTSYDKLANFLAVSSDGIWVSGWEGLQDSCYVARFDGTEWNQVNTFDLYGECMSKITVTPDGELWGIATSGIARFDGTSWVQYTGAEGLPVGNLTAITVDSQDILWILGDSALAYFNGKRWIGYSVPEDRVFSAIAFSMDNSMWIGLQDGVLHMKSLYAPAP